VVQLPRAEVLRVLRNAGFGDVAAELAEELPETVDLDRAHPLFERHHVDLGLLEDRMGGSP
jgi:hypothetical protein